MSTPAISSASDMALPSRLYAWSGALLGAALLMLLPLFLEPYRTFQLTLVIVYAIAILGLNLLTGYNGQISVGHGAFYAVGAYSAAILIEHAGFSYWATIPIAGAVCLVFGFAFGLPALRLEGHHLALATFALALAVPQLLKHKSLEDWTGGTQGLVILKPESPLPQLNSDQWLYYFALAIAVLLFVGARNLLRGPIGRSMVAVRDHPVAAVAMGVDAAWCKSATFGISAMYTGIAGALGAICVQFVSPDAFNFFFGITLLVGVAIGGYATLSGALYGALFIVFVPNVAGEVSKAAPWAIYGAVLVLVTLAMPGGVAGLFASIRRKFTVSSS